MTPGTRHLYVACVVVLLAVYAAAAVSTENGRHIPRTWDEAAIETLELPTWGLTAKVTRVSADFYYAIPVRTILRGYPVYSPSHEPPGYLEGLAAQEPDVLFHAEALDTTEDWIRAGRYVFEAPIRTEELTPQTFVRNPAWWKAIAPPVTREGILPGLTYVVRQRGQVELGVNACAACHTRVFPDGSVVAGAPTNFPRNQSDAFLARERAASFPDKKRLLEAKHRGMRMMFGAPWTTPDPLEPLYGMTLDGLADAEAAIPAGVMARHGTSFLAPVQVADLIGIKERRYLDRTGLQLHRDIGDLMRYAALNQGMDLFTSYGDFMPFGRLLEPEQMERYGDDQLYALALYLYSLEPPPNPNRPDATTRRGQDVFERERCGTCHTPPLYTNNKLVPATSGAIPDEHRLRFDILPMPIGLDARLTTTTRRGTGFYKVPSLKGVWYRGPLGHSGSVATLEDWFDPSRLRDTYMPTGFRPAGAASGAVPGHRFGLSLSQADKRALIAFLKTL